MSEWQTNFVQIKKIRLLRVSWLSIGLFPTVHFPSSNESKTFTFPCSDSIRSNHLSFEITIQLNLSKSRLPNVQIRSLTSIWSQRHGLTLFCHHIVQLKCVHIIFALYILPEVLFWRRQNVAYCVNHRYFKINTGVSGSK